MTGRIRTALNRRATAWAGMLTRIAKEFAPNHLRDVISSRVEPRGDDQYTIFLTAKIIKGRSEDAAAQEYGSGLHSENDPHLIEIVPKKGQYLVFKWDKVDYTQFRHTSDGKVMLKHVNHPGINPYRGIGYLRPAIQELKAKGRAELDVDVRNAILGDLAESFKHANSR